MDKNTVVVDAIIGLVVIITPIILGIIASTITKYLSKISDKVETVSNNIIEIKVKMDVAEKEFNEIKKDVHDLKKKVFHIGES